MTPYLEPQPSTVEAFEADAMAAWLDSIASMLESLREDVADCNAENLIAGRDNLLEHLADLPDEDTFQDEAATVVAAWTRSVKEAKARRSNDNPYL